MELLFSMRYVKSYFIYIILFALLMGIFWLSYVFSSILMYFAIGYLMLPIVVISFLYGIYWLWKWVFKKSDVKVEKFIILTLSYGIYLYLLVELDTYSWDGESNFNKYMSLVRWIINAW